MNRGGWRAWLITTTMLLAVWFALWGKVSAPLFLVGLAASALTVALFPLPEITFRFGLHPWRAVVLVARFCWDVVVASLEVAWLAVRPRPPRTAVVKVRLATDSDLLEHLTALAVSLVPGSLIIDADPEERVLTIHQLDNDRESAEDFAKRVLAQEERLRAALGDGSEQVRR